MNEPTLLLVEDDRRLLEVLEMRLRTLPCRILSALSGAGAIELARSGQPDLAVLDMHVHDTDGIQLLADLHALLGRPLPAIFLTGDTSHDRRQAAMRAGAIAVLTKPLRFDALAHAVRSALPAGIIR